MDSRFRGSDGWRVEVVFEDAAVEGLLEAVGGDEAEALDLAVAGQVGGVVPPEHDEIGGIWHLRPGGAQGFGVAVAKGLAHGGGADEGRVADDVVGLRPFGGARVGVAFARDLRGFVGYGFAGDGVGWVDFQQGAEVGDEELVVGALGAAGRPLAGKEGVDLHDDGILARRSGLCSSLGCRISLHLARRG